MNVLQLRYFITVAQLENVTKAADLLHISQSSLSKNISALEKELSVSLFDRNGKNIALNASGERFLESCKKIVSFPWSRAELQGHGRHRSWLVEHKSDLRTFRKALAAIFCFGWNSQLIPIFYY